MPERSAVEVERFKSFCRMHFRKFRRCTDWLDHEQWLEKSSYNENRKQQIRDAYDTYGFNNVTASFIKDELYTEIKAPRAINSYNDKIKYMLGPFIKTVEKNFFSNNCFVKGLTNSERDLKLEEICGDKRVGFTDFSSFESHHCGAYNDIFVEFVDYMRNGSCKLEFDMFKVLVKSVNKMRFVAAGVSSSVPERLMSGALWTSLQNSFLNIFMIKYLRFRSNDCFFDWDRMDTMVEGDDGIFTAFNVRSTLVRELGLKLKLEYAPHYRYASFCGRVVVDGICLTDPIKLLLKFQSMHMRYSGVKYSVLCSLYKAKALSYMEMYNGCPIVYNIAARIYERYRSYDLGIALKYLRDGWGWSDTMCDVKHVQKFPSPNVREVFSRLYGIGHESQEQSESWKGPRDLLCFEWPNQYVENIIATRIVNDNPLTTTKLLNRPLPRFCNEHWDVF